MTLYEPMTVARIRDDRGSHIAPPLEQSWSDLEKLRWQAGVVLVDSGVRVRISDDARASSNGVDIPVLGILIGRSSTSRTFRAAWDYLNGVSAGACEAIRQADNGEAQQ